MNEALPERHYPTRLIDRWTLADGRSVIVRPVLPQDAELEQSLVRELSPESRYQRFFNPLRELTPAALDAMTRIDYRYHVAIVAESFAGGVERVVGEARYVVDDDGAGGAEFALVVADDWRRVGLAGRLLCSLAAHARAAGLESLHGEVLATNQPMLALLRRLGFARRMHPGDARLVRTSFALHPRAGDGWLDPCAIAAAARTAAATAAAP
ncbi:MAG TPA: GNAT family N-acetyltransferase [Ideonella sp.]|nr:GNAT family N-acetyltransferase [Ideonella sp.]